MIGWAALIAGAMSECVQKRAICLSHLVFVSADEGLLVVVREEAVFETEIPWLPPREIFALLHQVTLLFIVAANTNKHVNARNTCKDSTTRRKKSNE